MAVQFHCAQNIATTLVLLSPSLLSFFDSLLSPSVFFFFFKHTTRFSLSGYHLPRRVKPRRDVPGTCCQSAWPRHLSMCVTGVGGCLMTIYKTGSSFWGSSCLFPSRLPAGLALLGTRGCWCWKLQSCHLIPELFFFFFSYHELFRQCFPELSSISTDPERTCITTPAPGLRGVSIFWLKEVAKGRIQSQCASLSGQ